MGKTVVLICGGGNGSHTLSGLASSNPKLEVRVLTLFADEAERWSTALKDSGAFTVDATYSDGTRKDIVIKDNKALVTKDPETAAKNADVIFFTVPAFAHQQYFDALKPYLNKGSILVGLPGQAGFEFQAISALGKEKASMCAILSFESLPWACRILDFGKKVQILGFKDVLSCSLIVGKNASMTKDPVSLVQTVLGEKPQARVCNNYIAVNLMAKSIIHPPIMFGKWSKWDGKPVKEKPLFYQGIDEEQSQMLSEISNELIATGKALEKQQKGIDNSEVIHIFDWYKQYYKDQISDFTNLMTAMRTNKAYDGLLHPMKEVDGGFVPDFTYRYTSEDVPFGLVVMKGIAEIAGVPTPTMDKVITFAQGKLGKEFIKDGKCAGADIKASRAPQAYGFKTVDDLFNI